MATTNNAAWRRKTRK